MTLERVTKNYYSNNTRDEDVISLSNASVVRSWSNGKGIGAIAQTEHKDEYTLDPIGDVEIRQDKVLFEIPCGW